MHLFSQLPSVQKSFSSVVFSAAKFYSVIVFGSSIFPGRLVTVLFLKVTLYLSLEFERCNSGFNSPLAVTVLSLAYNAKTEEKGP